MAAGPPPRAGRPSERRRRTNGPPCLTLLLPLPPVLSLTSLSLSFVGSHGRRTSMPLRARRRPVTSTLPPVLSGLLRRILLILRRCQVRPRKKRGVCRRNKNIRPAVHCRLSYTRGAKGVRSN
ncbi:hypothetical protein ACQJBY_026787 [Aegilops geniculata]